MKGSAGEYRPVACGLLDRIEAAATLGRACDVVYLDVGGEERRVTDRFVDWFVRDGEEYARLAGGLTLRLDRIVSLQED